MQVFVYMSFLRLFVRTVIHNRFLITAVNLILMVFIIRGVVGLLLNINQSTSVRLLVVGYCTGLHLDSELLLVTLEEVTDDCESLL